MDKIYNDAKTPIFSTRELEVADYISRGFSEKEIADKLHISRFIVNNHTRHIRANNGLSKNSEIIPAYIAHTKGKKFSLQAIKELGLGVLLVLLNVCDYTPRF